MTDLSEFVIKYHLRDPTHKKVDEVVCGTLSSDGNVTINTIDLLIKELKKGFVIYEIEFTEGVPFPSKITVKVTMFSPRNEAKFTFDTDDLIEASLKEVLNSFQIATKEGDDYQFFCVDGSRDDKGRFLDRNKTWKEEKVNNNADLILENMGGD